MARAKDLIDIRELLLACHINQKNGLIRAAISGIDISITDLESVRKELVRVELHG